MHSHCFCSRIATTCFYFMTINYSFSIFPLCFSTFLYSLIFFLCLLNITLISYFLSSLLTLLRPFSPFFPLFSPFSLSSPCSLSSLFFTKAMAKPAREIEGKREDESMKQFKERIKQETRLVRTIRLRICIT